MLTYPVFYIYSTQVECTSMPFSSQMQRGTSLEEPSKQIEKMAQFRRNVAILGIVMVVAVSLERTEAKDFIVGGDSIGWTSFPPGGASFYSKWASNLTFKVNDTLVFNFESGSHAVAILTKANYAKCKFNDNIQTYDTGPARVTLNRTGKFYFSCTFSGHCSSGQKLSVKVTGPSSHAPKKPEAPSPAEGPSTPVPVSGLVPTSPSNEGASPSSPTGSGSTATPSKGSATPLASTLPLLLTTIAFNFMSQF